jgi:integrase
MTIHVTPKRSATMPSAAKRSLNGGGEMARPASNLHLQPKNGGWRARVLVPVELQAKLGKKLFHTPVWRVSKSEAAALAWPEVQKFEALIEKARSGKCCSAVEVEAQAPLRPLVPSFDFRGIGNDASETTFTKLIAEWARKKRIDNPQTKQQRETHFRALAEFLGHDNGAGVTSRDIVRFEKYLETTPDPRTGKSRHPNTVLGYLSSFRGVFTIAVQQILIETNPMDNVMVGSKIESKRQPYSVDQVRRILARAQAETDDIFLPLLVQAYSGCRVSEIVDCSTLDFNFVRNGDLEKVIPGKWFLFIGEDHREPGCTIKGHKARYVPLHPEIVKRLIPYMEKQMAESDHGPLFRHLPKDKNGKRSTYVARKIDEWMDGVIKDPNLAPNHSFRHYLKSELLARDVPERISDAITGHKTPGIGRKYEHVPMSKKFDAISKLPAIPLHQPAISVLGTNPIANKIT